MLEVIAKKTCDVLSMLSGFHSVVLDVGDFDSAVGDYARLLGQPPGWIESNPDLGERAALFPLANMRLELRAKQSAPEAPDAAAPKGLSGLRLLCDRVDSFAGVTLPGVAQKADRPEGEAARSWISTKVDPEASRSLPIELISDETGPTPLWIDPGTDRGRSHSLDSPSAVRALDHVVVFSTDLDATRMFYADRLGIRLALDRTFEKRGVRLIFFRIGGVTIEIAGRLDVEPQSDAVDRFGGLAWQVPDIDAIQARLREDRFDVSEIRDGNKPGTRVCTVRDPVHDVPTLLIEPLS